jgi:hypothetical protein
MDHYKAYFPASYEASRQRFRAYLESVRQRWPQARLVTRPLAAEEGLSLDWIEAGANQTSQKALVFTLGEHGIEAFVGSAMLELFMQEFLADLDPDTTGLTLVHALNPWGMQHLRRVNAANVDLNRNFVTDARSLDPTTNPDYARVNDFLNPARPPASPMAAQLGFYFGLVQAVARLGMSRFRAATLLGQYRFERGIYYGGESVQEETRCVMDLFRQALTTSERTLLLDMHTGYGPRQRMSVVNSALEPRSSPELASLFGYPDVVKSDPSEFYAIQGDMIDYIYSLVRQVAPEKYLYATTFEFGTFGDSFGAVLRSLRTMILENQAYWYKAGFAGSDGLKAHIAAEMLEMFNPQAADWQARAIENGRAAFRGILKVEGYLLET